jgi:hypothetical protein
MTLEERILAVLEVIAYQQSGRTHEIGLSLAGVYRAYAERTPAAPDTTHDGQEGT